jgi:hypothetical protein
MAITKTATSKPTTTKTATVKKAAPKKTTVKKPAAKSTTKKAATKKTAASPEALYKMTEVAAYYIALNDGFKGNPSDYWIQAEIQIKELHK